MKPRPRFLWAPIQVTLAVVLCTSTPEVTHAADEFSRAVPAAGGPAQTRAAYTPARGSTERKAILHALRSNMRRSDSRPVVFVVRHLKLQNGWAWLQVEPQSPDGRSRYEGEAALLQRRGGRWQVVERMPALGEREGTSQEADCAYFEQLRTRFRSVPLAILPPAGKASCRSPSDQ